ncbi:MAG TPA: ATP-grasp domain-containing protein [Pseudonocardiaceae bacterium]|jgi:predicted ATP-grasp superfamily ATP-dependent carboligase|nr:ATP-grasp domain-containing protein [Pseudonocardiaceae bacterium]
MAHLAVFGDLFDIADRAQARFGAAEKVRVTAFVQRSRLAGCDGIDRAHAIVALPDDAPVGEWVDAVRMVHAAHPITHAAALVDHLAVAAATALADLGVEFHSPQTMRDVCDKAATRRVLDRQGRYPVPHRVAADPATLISAAAEIGFPCVVKPLSSTGSVGVSVVRDAEALAAAYRRAAVADGRVLVERYLAGPQYSVEAMSEGGEHVVLALTRKYSDPQSFVEIGHVMPAPLSDAQRSAIVRCAVDVLDAVGLTYGPSHTEIVLTEDGPMPIETHARVGGDDIWLMVHAATGVDLDEVQPDQIFGLPVLDRVRSILAGPPPQRLYQAVWFGATRAEATFAGLTVPAEIAEGQHVEVAALLADGASVRPLASSNDRIIKVRSSGTSAAEALGLAVSAAERVAAASGLPTDLTKVEATC